MGGGFSSVFLVDSTIRTDSLRHDLDGLVKGLHELEVDFCTEPMKYPCQVGKEKPTGCAMHLVLQPVGRAAHLKTSWEIGS